MTVQILEPDDGSGWAKVQGTDGNSGLVPASYIEELGTESPSYIKERGTTAISNLRDSADFMLVRALYSYKGQTPEELDIAEGEILELSPGGKQYGEGWWEGTTFVLSLVTL